MAQSWNAIVLKIVNRIFSGSLALYDRCAQRRCAPPVIPRPLAKYSTKAAKRLFSISAGSLATNKSFDSNVKRDNKKNSIATEKCCVDPGRCQHKPCSINRCQMHIRKEYNISPHQFQFAVVGMLQFDNVLIQSSVNGLGIAFI